MSVGSRLPAFALLGLVLIGTALLLAGYGPAVGAGAIVGLLLGLLVATAFGAMSRRGCFGTGVSGSWVSGLSQSGTGPDHDLIMQHGRDWTRVAGVDSGPLRRVVAVRSSVTAVSVQLELISLEIREDGLIATLGAHTRPPIAALGHLAFAAVSDDAGTIYLASAQSSGGSGPGTTRFELRAAPAPPATARLLTLRIEQFANPFAGPATGVKGPWEFPVRL